VFLLLITVSHNPISSPPVPYQCWKQDQYFQTKTKTKTRSTRPRPRPKLQDQDQDQDRCIRTSIRIKLNK